ncbi:hypothetical protein K469DRAFT_756291 [Zopfia rhizophila CBS 207.26]|uniref:Lysine-specific metallo-endopeptidase domain-containing protein n=1 Tax=Zopfia rhizophila CBS 207.26 TaxID=1314779 RepID=A0A6A6D9W8_9PEZI|nr:hypothetical protein K469DRAFT_756291 [Zopfia rhizophila CBS 207.26]
MPFFSKPAHMLCTLLSVLHVVAFAAGYTIDPKSCTGDYKSRVQEAMDEVSSMVTYAEKRAAQKSPYKRQGTLLQDLLNASDEDDAYVLTQVRSWFSQVKGTVADKDVVIHCDDKHLTKADGRNDLYYDNSNNRQARVQVLNSANRKSNACGGIQRAFEYPFLDKTTGRTGGKAIVLCSDSSVGALKAADADKDLAFWRDKDLRSVSRGVDFFGRFLSYMILHELMHATDGKQFPVNPGGQAELYGYEKITGHAVGASGGEGPNSLVRLHNADSYALLACGWYMNGYYFENGKFTITPKKERPPITLRRRFPELDAREPKGGSKPKTSKAVNNPPPATTKASPPPPATSKAAPPPSSEAPPPPSSSTRIVPPPSSQAPPSSKATPSSQGPSSQAPPSKSVQPSSSRQASSSLAASSTSISSITSTSSGSLTISFSTTSSSSSSSTSSEPPIVTAIGEPASKIPPIPNIVIPILPIPDSGDSSLNATIISGNSMTITSLASTMTASPRSGFITSVLATSDAGSGTVVRGALRPRY